MNADSPMAEDNFLFLPSKTSAPEPAMETTTINVATLALFSEEFVGLMFFGTGNIPKGRLVSASMIGGTRRTEVVFERPTPFGPNTVQDYPNGATVRVEKRA